MLGWVESFPSYYAVSSASHRTSMNTRDPETATPIRWPFSTIGSTERQLVADQHVLGLVRKWLHGRPFAMFDIGIWCLVNTNR